MLGERTFIFGGEDGDDDDDDRRARGLRRYYSNGIIEQTWVSYTKFGPYAHCNHPNGSTVYSCDNNSPYVGMEDDSHSGGIWYSFNHLGENSEWQQGDYPYCPSIRLSAKTVIDALAARGGCVGCPSLGCAKCILQMCEADYAGVWNEAFRNQEELEMLNTSGSDDLQFGKPKELEVLNASGVVLV